MGHGIGSCEQPFLGLQLRYCEVCKLWKIDVESGVC